MNKNLPKNLLSSSSPISDAQLRGLLNFSLSAEDRILFYESMNRDELMQFIKLLFSKAGKREVFATLNFQMMRYFDTPSLAKIAYYMACDRYVQNGYLHDENYKKKLMEDDFKRIVIKLGKQLQNELELVYKRDNIFVVHQMTLSFLWIILEHFSRLSNQDDSVVNNFFAQHEASQFNIRHSRAQRKPKHLNNKS